eukprot:g75580.t1
MESCFGGAALYSLPALAHAYPHCRYAGYGIEEITHALQWAQANLPDACKFASNCSDYICEHIPFHFCLRQHGAKIGLVRDLVVKSVYTLTVTVEQLSNSELASYFSR